MAAIWNKYRKFHVFIFSAQPIGCWFYLSHGIPNDHLGWVCGSSWGFHMQIRMNSEQPYYRCKNNLSVKKEMMINYL